MKTLSFQIEDHVVAEILGVQNFTSDESAILEIVKNAYDAGASHLELHFVNNILEIIDDGIGMSLDDIYINYGCMLEKVIRAILLVIKISN